MFNLIFISHRNGVHSVRRSLHAPWHFVLLGTAAALLFGGVAAGSFLIGRSTVEQGASWRVDLARQQTRLADDQAQSRAVEMKALTQRVARLQSHITRLDALGRKLVSVAGIDADEFDFDRPPGLGGPLARGNDWAQPGASEVEAALDRLRTQVDDRSRQLAVLDDVLAERRLTAAATPAGEPIGEGWMSSHYGYRKDPFTGKRAWHDGVDFAGRAGSPVKAVGAGVVTFAGERWGYGKLVEVTHGDGYVTRYGHNSKIVVEEGDIVRRGDKVAEMGSTGRSTGPHVHLEVLRNGKSVNPWNYVQAER